MKTRKKYDPKKCQHRIIAIIKDNLGNEVALLAHHAFNWSIVKKTDGVIEITNMPRVKARQEYKKLEKLMKT